MTDLAETTDPIVVVLDDLESDDKLDKEHVLDAARDPSSPLHPKFEWDDTVAAEAHRLEQARQLIAHYRQVKIDREGGEIQVRRYSHVGSVGRWRRTDKILTGDLAAELLAAARRDFEIWYRRHERLGAYRQAIIDEITAND